MATAATPAPKRNDWVKARCSILRFFRDRDLLCQIEGILGAAESIDGLMAVADQDEFDVLLEEDVGGRRIDNITNDASPSRPSR